MLLVRVGQFEVLGLCPAALIGCELYSLLPLNQDVESPQNVVACQEVHDCHDGLHLLHSSYAEV